MSKEVVVLAVHGMGDTEADFADELEEHLADEMGSNNWGRVLFDRVFYQSVLQPNQRRVMKAMRKKEIDYIKLRKFLLYGFSDAAGLEHKASDDNSPYEQAQVVIRDALIRAHDFIGEPKPVVIVAHSLGGQVISNYIWDAQRRPAATRGVWKRPSTQPGTPLDNFLRLKQLKTFYTTGCNIPIFIAGFNEADIKPIKVSTNGYGIQWKNFYDEDDVLGWPLKPLNTLYRNAIHQDKQVNANGGFFGSLTQGWNPLSHQNYWRDSDVIRPLARDVRALLP